VPQPLRGSGFSQDAGFMTAPSGTTPWVANRHKAINSFRASATTITLRMRRPVPLMRSYFAYYNETRTHLSLDKDAPVSRAIQTVGRIFARPVLGGLHHQYVRV
jgi:hypothetical protein